MGFGTAGSAALALPFLPLSSDDFSLAGFLAFLPFSSADFSDDFSGYSQPVRREQRLGKGRHAGGVGVFVSQCGIFGVHTCI